MPRPDITSWSGPLFKRQLRAALDWLESMIGTGGGGGSGTFDLDDGTASTTGAFTFDEGGA